MGEKSQRDEEEAPTSYKWAAQRFWRWMAESVLARMVSLVTIHLKLHSAWWYSLPARLCGELLGEPLSSCACETKLSGSERKEHNASRWKALIISR